ncbi:MAG: 2'-5' RNA ligase family protein [Bacteroidetes bacterium]|nr:2'-5' RNA ligase family protein [Bacteroidota bacterium]
MTSPIRRQLTLFVQPDDATVIEQIRQTYNPLQYEIIKAHVTLCREDEIENLDHVLSNLHVIKKTQPGISIEFGKVSRFDNGKGLFLPAGNDSYDFDNLRRQVLSGIIQHPRKQAAHITLMHPRNSTCTDSIFELVSQCDFPAKLQFRQISLIEQENGGSWKTLMNFELKIN